MARGFTNTNPDMQDLYLEQINPANPQQYRVPGPGLNADADAKGDVAWADFTSRDEII